MMHGPLNVKYECNEILWGSDGIKILHIILTHLWSFDIYNKTFQV